MKQVFIALLCIIHSQLTWAQATTQTIKGIIQDAQSKYPLAGANIIVVGSTPLIGTSTDVEGNFRLTNVPLGRQALKISYLGFQERVISNILVTSGKEVVLTIDLEEQV